MFTSKKFIDRFASLIVILSIVLSGFQPAFVSAQGGAGPGRQVHAQTGGDGLKRHINPQNGRVSFIGPESGRVLPASKALGTFLRPQDPGLALMKRFAPEFGIKNPDRDLSELKKNQSDDGRVSVRYQQKYQGIPVLGGELIVNTNQNGDLYSMNGEVSPDLSLPIQPTIDSAQATQTALTAVAKWYEKTPADFVASPPELWIFDESLLQPSTRPVELVWRMEVTAVDNTAPVRELVLVNAERGNLSLHFNQIDNAWGRTVAINPVQAPVTTVLSSTNPEKSDNPVTGQPTTENMPTLVPVTWYVATTGLDSNSCSSTGSPCLTINGAIGKAASTGDTIKVATGTYTGSGTEVVLIDRSITLSGGWNAAFTIQSGQSTINGQGARRGVMVVNISITAIIERLIVQNGNSGGISNEGTLTLNNSTVSSNFGGGIFNGGNLNSTPILMLNNTIVSNNSTLNSGGGIINSYGNLTLNNSSVSNNSASSYGGGIYNTGVSMTLNNTTVSNNSSSSYGGGIYNTGGNVTLNNITVSNNSTSYGSSGGGIYSTGPTSLKNSILSGNIASEVDSDSDCYGITSSGNNIISKVFGCATPVSGDQFNVNPMLGTFLPAPGYQPLLSGSPAINAGNPATCLSTDQRGVARVGTCDIGAYEYTVPGAAASLSIVSGNNQRSAPNLAFSRVLQAVVLDSQGTPVNGINVIFTGPSSGASGIFANSGTRITTVNTDSGGVATTSTFTANSQFGVYAVSASATGLTTINFNLENAAWYVSPSGNDANSCTLPASPCLTINGAIGKAISGDTINVAIGTYTGSGTYVVLINKSITLSGGWNVGFTTQGGMSTIDGQNLRSGMLADSGGVASINRFTIKNGSSSYGGGILNNLNSTLTLNNSTVSNNSASFTGGGIQNGGNLTINSSSVNNNSGGGIYNNWILKINNSSIHSNSGGGITSTSTPPNLFGSLTLNNSTVSNNSGSGIYNSGYSFVTLNNTTISNNSTSTYGGGIYSSGNVILKNSLLAGNTGSGANCWGSISSAGNNIISNTSGCLVTPISGDQFNVNPLLGTFLPEQGYHPLLSGSPAINAGNPAICLPTDQRGVARVGTCDIGAYEYTTPGSASSLWVLSGGGQLTVPLFAFSNPLKAVILDSQGSPVPNVNVTFTAPASGASGTFAGSGTNTSSIFTDGGGVATTSVFIANSQLGSYIVTASSTGLTTVNFNLENAAWTATPLVSTYTANLSSLLPGSFLCNQTQQPCTIGNANPHADAAHKYAIGTYNFYATKFNRDSIDNNGMVVKSTVQYCSPYFACPYDNSFWSGDQIVYGSAYDEPLGDDVVAHEFTHGVTQYESNLFYYYQSGAINESLSDVFGEYYDQTNGLGTDITNVNGVNVKWLIGEDIVFGGLGSFRSMSNPPAYSDPDKMSSPYYYEGDIDSGGVHTNSGVNNKAVYLMVDGGTFNGKTVTLLGWEKTGAIYYEANTNLLVSGADYSDLYYALQQACTNLIGQHGIVSGDCVEVKDAVDAVEMNGQPAPNFNTEAPLCGAGQLLGTTTFYDDLESGTSNWTFSNGAYPRWQYDSPYMTYAHSGSHFLYADNYPEVVTDATARLASMVIPANAYLHFAHAYDFETSSSYYWDGGVLEYSTNNGASWMDAGPLIDYNGYTGVIYPDYINPLKGRSAFVGSSHGYISTRLNLASLAGQTVTFRWRLGLDDYGSSWGWWLDDVRVYKCSVTLSGNAGVAGATLYYTDGTLKTVTADISGNYSITIPYGWSGTVTPYKTGYTFTPLNKAYNNIQSNQTLQSYTAQACPTCADINVLIGGNPVGSYTLGASQSTRQVYPLDSGPVKVSSTNAVELIAALRDAWLVNSGVTSFAQLMGLPQEQLSDTYYFPAYNNVTLSGQLRIGNVDSIATDVTVTIGGVVQNNGQPYHLEPNQSVRPTYTLDAGPVVVQSNNGAKIIAALRDAWLVNGGVTSFTQLMGLPKESLSDTYYFPAYNNVTLSGQLRIGNVDTIATDVTVTIGGVVQNNGQPYHLLPNQSVRPTYTLDSGPVVVTSSNGAKIIAALRDAWLVNGQVTSFAQLMGLPKEKLSDTYLLPAYNNVTLSGQLRIGNVDTIATDVTVTIGGVLQNNGQPYHLEPNQSVRPTYNLDSGPVVVQSNNGAKIIVALRDAWLVNGSVRSFVQTMALPQELLSTTYWFPAYNNVTLSGQLRFAVP